MAQLQRELQGKGDQVVMLGMQLEKLKEQKNEEEALRRAVTGELQRVRQEADGSRHGDERAAKEVQLLKDTVAGLQTALEKEKGARAAARSDSQKIEEAHAAALRALASERDAREAKLKKETQEAAELVGRLKADLKSAQKDGADRLRIAQAESAAQAERVESAQQEAKKLRERLAMSQQYIEALGAKQQTAGSGQAPTAARASLDGDAHSAMAGASKALEHQHALLQGVVDALRRKEADTATELSALQKRETELRAALTQAEMKSDQSRQEIRALQLSVEQCKQAQRATEQRALRAEQALEEYRTASVLSVENAMTSENKLAAEYKRLRAEAEKAALLHQATVAKLQEALREAQEERDGALDMLATNQLDADAEVDRQTRALKEEHSAARQSAAALEQRNAELQRRLREQEAALQSLAQAREATVAVNGPTVHAGRDELAEAFAALKREHTQLQAEQEAKVRVEDLPACVYHSLGIVKRLRALHRPCNKRRRCTG